MATFEPPSSGPAVDELMPVFRVYEIRTDGDQLVYYGEPRVPRERLMQRVWPLFRDEGYEVTLSRQRGEFVLVAEPVEIGLSGVPWTNILLFVATVASTLYAGANWYHVDVFANPENVLVALPFALAVMGVLGTHELGHYVMSRYHKVDATLPYFLPMPTLIGTMGAVIKMKGQMPNRKALFDIGVAGPLAGLVATVFVTAVGLMLDPVTVPRSVFAMESTIEVEFGYPLLMHLLADLLNRPLEYSDPRTFVNPVVIGGWVGMFVTFLNLLPVGQLDGGHIVRAMVGKRQETVAATVPLVLFALAGYLFYARGVGNAVGIWVFWGFFSMIFAYVGPATPISDDELDTKRKLVGLLTFVLGVLCFSPIPITIG